MIRMLSVVILLVAAGILASSLASPTIAADSPERMVMRYCTQCHDTERICRRLGALDTGGWKSIVERMIIKKGRRMSYPGQKEGVINYLASQRKGSKPICR